MISTRTTLAILLSLSLLTFLAAPSALAEDAAPAADFVCAPGFIGDAVCAVLGLTCEVVVFLLGPGSCVD